jgi:hypothetical protein
VSVFFPESEQMRENQSLGFDEILMTLGGTYHLIQVQVRQVLLLFDLIALLIGYQPEAVSQVLILTGDLEVLNLSSFMVLLKIQEVFSQLQV